MAGPRDRSRHRGIESQKQYELQDMQTSHCTPTGEGSSARVEDSYDGHHHGHPQNSGARRLDRGILGTCKERLAGVLGTRKARMAGNLWRCMEMLARHGMATFLMAFIVCVLIILAFRRLSPSAKPFDDRLETSSGRAAGHDQPMITIIHSHTVYRTVQVNYKQFYGARPVHHQAPLAVPSNLEPRDRIKREGLTHPHIGTGTPTSVSGLYFMPMSIANGDRPQTQQDRYRSSGPASNIEGLQSLQGNPSLRNSEPEAKSRPQSSGNDAPQNLSIGQAAADITTFTRWGVEEFYSLHRRGHRSLHLYKGWCIENACSPPKQLISMCNTTKTISNSFRKQECEWCWPKNKKKQIDKHCTEVSKRALNAVFIICGILLFCMLVIAIVLATRMLRRRRMAKAERMPNKHATTASTLHEKSNGAQTHQFLHDISKLGRSSKAARSKVNHQAISESSPGEATGPFPWYKAVFAKSEKRSGIAPTNPASIRSRLQKHRTKPLDQEIAIGVSDSHERVPVLPPAPPAISSHVFSDVENMGQGSWLSGAGIINNLPDPKGMPRPASRQSRAVRSGSEQSLSQATHRRSAGANVYNLHRLTERS